MSAQPLKLCVDFVKRANALWTNGCNFGAVLIELGREINACEESGAWKDGYKTCAEFLKKNLPWYNERRVRALKHVARCKDAAELIESMGEPLQIADKPKRNKGILNSEPPVSSAAVALSTTPSTKQNLSSKPPAVVD